MPDYKKIAEELKALVEKLGVSQKDLQNLTDRGGPANQIEQKLKEVDTALASLQAVTSQTQLSETERKRKIAQMEADIDLLRITNANSPDFQERLDAQRELIRLTTALGTYKTADVLRIEDLLDDSQDEIKLILAEAAKDIAARQNFARVMNGIGLVLRVAVFSAALTSKLAIAV
jgi:hypothetical protein